jgi:limonene-1,2-epoxide hydrolase
VSRAVVERYFAALNADRLADLEEVFSADVEIHTVGMRPVVGRDAAIAHFRRVLAGYAAHEDRVTRWLEAGDAIVTEIDFEGALDGGRPIAFSALDVFDLADGRIRRVATWYDTHDVRRQVGALRARAY